MTSLHEEPTEATPRSARLVDVSVPAHPSGVVLVLHGGASRGRSTGVSPAQLSVLRMIPVAARIAHAAGDRLAVLRLLNSRRGWDTAHSPVQDVRWALDEVAERFGPDMPVCVVGHSLGGRAALLSAAEPQVHGVVALAPWVLPTDPVVGKAGTPIVIIHGEGDRIASPRRSRQIARSLAREAPVAYVTVARGTHAMLRRSDAFDGLAARCVLWMLLGQVEGETVRRIAAGETSIEV